MRFNLFSVLALSALLCSACLPLEGTTETATGTATVRNEGENVSSTAPLGQGESLTVNAVRDATHECACGAIEVFNGNTHATGERYRQPFVIRQGSQRTEIPGPGTIFTHFKLVKVTTQSRRHRQTGIQAIKGIASTCGRETRNDPKFVRDGDLPAFDLSSGSGPSTSFGAMDVPMRIVPDTELAQIRGNETLPCVITKEAEGIIAIVVEPVAQPCAFVRWKSSATITVTQTDVTATYRDYDPVVICRSEAGFGDVVDVFRNLATPSSPDPTQPTLPPLRQKP